MPNNTIFYIQAPRPPLKAERETEREREGGGRKYIHQEGTAVEPVEKVLMSFFNYLHYSYSHYDHKQ